MTLPLLNSISPIYLSGLTTATAPRSTIHLRKCRSWSQMHSTWNTSSLSRPSAPAQGAVARTPRGSHRLPLHPAPCPAQRTSLSTHASLVVLTFAQCPRYLPHYCGSYGPIPNWRAVTGPSCVLSAHKAPFRTKTSTQTAALLNGWKMFQTVNVI